MNDFSFTFDVAPFKAGIDKITSMMSGMAKSSANAAQNMSAAMSSALNGMMTKVGALAGAYLGLKSLIGRIPEIGKTFEIAGDIISRNFLWPLRKELAPYLQKVLDWVRDNRTLFVQWGNVLVNVFRAIKQIVIGAYEAIKPLFETLWKNFSARFLSGVKSIGDAVNILIFKITVIAMFITDLIRPVVMWLGRVTNALFEIGDVFMSGFFEGFSDVFGTWSEVLDGLLSEFVSLMRILNDDSFDDFFNIIKVIARILGEALGGAVKLVIILATQLIQIFSYFLTGDVGRLPDWMQSLGNIINNYVLTPLRTLWDIAVLVFDILGKIVRLDFRGLVGSIGQVGRLVSGLLGGGGEGPRVGGALAGATSAITGGPRVSGGPQINNNQKTANVTSSFRIENLNVNAENNQQAQMVGSLLGQSISSTIDQALRRSINNVQTSTGN